jgi:hypothetical protein
MFLAHWAATEPRETVVKLVKSEFGSAERRSIRRQKRTTARSALRRFTSSAAGLREAALLGTADEATGVGKGLGWESGLLQLEPLTSLRRNMRPLIGSRGFSCLLRRDSCLGHVGALMAVAAAMRRLG